MNKTDMKNFKKNCIEQVWWWANQPWVVELLDFPLIYTLNKFKFGKNLHKQLLKLRFFFKRKPVMPIAEYMITTRCTLNCKHCNSSMPKFTDDTHIKAATFEEYKKDLDTLLNAVDYIGFLGLVGGEPTLAKDLPEMIEYACSKKQIHQVFLATNCTILPTPKLLKAMQNKKFAVQMSDYSHVTNIKNNVKVQFDEFKKLLTANKIKYNSYQEKRGAVTWFTMPEVYMDKQCPQSMTKQYRQCVQTCNLITDGVMIPCTMAPYIYRNLELSPEIKSEIIDLRASKSQKQLTEEIIKYFSRPYPSFCNYCHFENIVGGLPCGEQV